MRSSALAETIVGNFWRLRRIPKIEALLHEFGSAKLRVSQAEKLVTQFESTAKGRMLASLEKKKVAARDRQAHDEAEERLVHDRAHLDEPAFNVACVLETSPEPFLNLWRHEAALGRSLMRTLHELERLKAKSAGLHVPVPEVLDVDVSDSSPSEVEGTGPNGKIEGTQQIKGKSALI